MRCGAKRFVAIFVLDQEKVAKTVTARTPAEARKTIRSTYGDDVYIQSVRVKQRS